MPTSVLILTLDEEINIAACIASVGWSDDVVVLDSFSADATVEIARSLGARVIQRKFDDWSTHQNWALENISFQHPWVFYLDADERCTPELADEIKGLVGQGRANGFAAFRLRRKDFLFDRWLRHAQLYPTWLVRLFRPGDVLFHRLVNPVPLVQGEVGVLDQHLAHYPFSHGFGHWINRHNRYSDFEAIEASRSKPLSARRAADVFARDPNLRRRALKEVFLRVPMRPAVKFIYYYLVRRGFLDGRPGLIYASLQAIYEYLILLKTMELEVRAPDRRRAAAGAGAESGAPRAGRERQSFA